MIELSMNDIHQALDTAPWNAELGVHAWSTRHRLLGSGIDRRRDVGIVADVVNKDHAWSLCANIKAKTKKGITADDSIVSDQYDDELASLLEVLSRWPKHSAGLWKYLGFLLARRDSVAYEAYMIKMFADFLNTQDGIRHREARTERRQKTQEEEKCRSNGESALHVIERGEIVSLTSSLLGSYGDARVQGHDDLQLVQRRRVEQVLIRKHRKQFDSLLRSKLASVAVMDHELWSRSSNSNVTEGAIGRRHTTSS